MSRRSALVVAVLTAAVLATLALPLPYRVETIVSVAVASAALTVAWVSLVHGRPSRGLGWTLVLAGFTSWTAGDLLWSVKHDLMQGTGYPEPSTVLYLLGYGLLILGTLTFCRGGRERHDVDALLDALILAGGLVVPLVVFVLAPIATDSSLTAVDRWSSGAYPVCDVVLLGMLAHLVWSPTARSWSYVFLVGSITTSLVADAAWTLSTLVTSSDDTTWWMELMWQLSYVLIAAAVLHPSMASLGAPRPTRTGLPSRVRVGYLAVGALMPAVTLFCAGIAGIEIPWLAVSVGGAALTVAVLLRMLGLVRTVRDQTERLAAQARADPLTGAPNRRTWDYQLSRACGEAQALDLPLSVAMLDLDHFKDYNDTFGHQAGDEALRSAVAAWSELLRPGEMLARYGGEEFTVVLPRTDLGSAIERIESMRAATPLGLTVSAGVAQWIPGTAPETTVAAADRALYDAKRAGRDRVAVSSAVDSADSPGEQTTV